MTESEWLASGDPQRMLACLSGGGNDWTRLNSPLVSDRKLRLFACACCRNSRGPSDPSPKEVDEYELHGHMLSTQTDLEWATRWATDHKESNQIHAAILREIVGNPFRIVAWKATASYANGITAPRLNPDWLTQTVLNIAKSIYDSRDFAAMPILADALEDGGCVDKEILRHCRNEERCPICAGAGFVWNDTGGNVDKGHCRPCQDTGWIAKRSPCVRGCWVLDLLLGKE